jgi:hypothetical protein
MELETTFYIMAIVYMSLMFILFIALLIAVFVIKAKIDRLHAMVEERVDQAKSIATKATVGWKTLKYFIKSK